MPDSITPVGTMYPPTNPIAALSSIYGIQQQQVNLAQQKQALQTGQYQQQTAQAQSQQAQQQNTELQGLSTFAKNASKDPSYQLPDGSLDTQKFTNGALAVAPVYGPEHIGQVVSMAKESVATRKAVQDLSGEQNSQLGNSLAGLATNKDAKWSDVLDVIGQQRANNPNPEYGRALDNIQGHIDKQDIQGSAQKMMSALKGVLNVSPSTVETPTNIYPGTTNVFSGQFNPSGQNVPKNMPQQAVTYPNKQLGTMGGPSSGGALSSNFFTPQNAVRSAYGGAPPNVGGGGQSPPAPPQTPGKLQPLQRPDRNAPGADQENYNASIAGAKQEYSAVSQAANDPMNGVQATRFRNQQVIDLAPHAGTGPGMKVMNTIASRLPGSTGDAYQDLEHYAAQNSAALAKLMGVPGTNLGAETAAAAAGNTERNPGALLEITKTNDALNTAMDLYNRGLAKVSNNGSDVSKVPAYKQAFGQNLDVNALRWADAHRRGDQQEIQQLQQKFKPQQIAGFAQKLSTLKSLAATGDLP